MESVGVRREAVGAAGEGWLEDVGEGHERSTEVKAETDVKAELRKGVLENGRSALASTVALPYGTRRRAACWPRSARRSLPFAVDAT